MSVHAQPTPSPLPAAVPSNSALRIVFAGAPGTVTANPVRVPAPWLAGEPEECLFPAAAEIAAVDGVRLFRQADTLIGCASEPLGGTDVAARTEALYRRLLAACRGRSLYRMWNYVPAINATTSAGENYRAFCVGRARAFEQVFGPGFELRLPAASAVGSAGSRLDVVFVAGEPPPLHVENPEQVPAYRYPAEHGPRSPSFARATVARIDGRPAVFVSGTAAIKGHRTIAPGDLEAQLDCTLDNLRLISQALARGDAFAAEPPARRCFKIYLRHPEDLARARARLEGALIGPGDIVTYLQADICRAALNVEIEVTLLA